MTNKTISVLTAAAVPVMGTEVLPSIQGGVTKKVTVSDLTAGRDVATKNIVAGTTAVDNTQVTVQASASNNANEPEFNLFSAVFAGLNKPRIKSANGTLALLVESGSTSTFQKRMRVRLDGGGVAQVTLQSSTDNGATYVDRVTVAGATGDTTLNTGNLIQGTAAKGVNFTANTPAAGMTSQLLNNYEEGTWTPTVTPTVGALSGVNATGTYTRVGRKVYITFNLQITANGTGAGQIKLTGIPFTPAQRGFGVGQETDVVGFPIHIQTIAGTDATYIGKYDTTYPGGTSYRLMGDFTYIV